MQIENTKSVTLTDEFDTINIKEQIFQILKEKSGASEIDYVKKRIKKNEDVKRGDKKGEIILSKCIADLKDANLIRIEGKRGISLTDKGDEIAQMGYSKYRNKQKKKERLKDIYIRIKVISVIVTIVGTVIGICDSIFKINLIQIEFKSFAYGCIFTIVGFLIIQAIIKVLSK